ncbi:unnamed protein product [Chilo suppressalis]|uniref:ATP-dependent DNA helicase n=1 Tax=Chilo suppressalis TaxID=168631 RepID=A0ABN8B3M2_CHISP|nr:unnamed protein product [Chilo suppressalis]
MATEQNCDTTHQMFVPADILHPTVHGLNCLPIGHRTLIHTIREQSLSTCPVLRGNTSLTGVSAISKSMGNLNMACAVWPLGSSVAAIPDDARAMAMLPCLLTSARKTFVATGILAEVRRQGKIAIAVASSGIAATLLPGGKTAHAMFKIPIDLKSAETPVCGVLPRNTGHVLKDCSLIIWDECKFHKRRSPSFTALSVDMKCKEETEYTFDARTGKCYKFHRLARTWSRAYMNCMAEGAHLAIINSDIEAKVLKEIFEKNPAGSIIGGEYESNAYIGFNAWTERSDFRTIEGQILKEAGYEKYYTGEPTNLDPGEFCGTIYRAGLIGELWCDKRIAFICEKDPSSLSCDDY